MKNIVFLFILICIGCTQMRDQYILYQPQGKLKGAVILSSKENLNVFYDIAVLGDYIACLDFFNDGILQIYDNSLFPEFL